MKLVLVVVAVLIVGAGAQLLLDAARHPAAVAPSPTLTASVSVSATPTPTATPTRSPTPTPTPYVPTPPPPPPPTVTISGAGPGNSRVFTLNDTTGYLARYTIGSSCQYNGNLVSTDGTYNNTDFITDTGPTSATKILNNLPIANYYIAMTTGSGCTWSVTFSPR
jgi:hypothetical protein